MRFIYSINETDGIDHRQASLNTRVPVADILDWVCCFAPVSRENELVIAELMHLIAVKAEISFSSCELRLDDVIRNQLDKRLPLLRRYGLKVFDRQVDRAYGQVQFGG